MLLSGMSVGVREVCLHQEVSMQLLGSKVSEDYSVRVREM